MKHPMCRANAMLASMCQAPRYPHAYADHLRATLGLNDCSPALLYYNVIYISHGISYSRKNRTNMTRLSLPTITFPTLVLPGALLVLLALLIPQGTGSGLVQLPGPASAQAATLA